MREAGRPKIGLPASFLYDLRQELFDPPGENSTYTQIIRPPPK